MNINDRIYRVGQLLKGRLGDDLVEAALEYVQHREPVLAIETLCDSLIDRDVGISIDEFEEMFDIAAGLGVTEGVNRYKYVKDVLVRIG